jgi:hypothetical protein
LIGTGKMGDNARYLLSYDLFGGDIATTVDWQTWPSQARSPMSPTS